jgi:hypothetical protein
VKSRVESESLFRLQQIFTAFGIKKWADWKDLKNVRSHSAFVANTENATTDQFSGGRDTQLPSFLQHMFQAPETRSNVMTSCASQGGAALCLFFRNKPCEVSKLHCIKTYLTQSLVGAQAVSQYTKISVSQPTITRSMLWM